VFLEEKILTLMVVNSDTTTDKKKKIYGYFKQKNATVHTANYSTAGL
jgi:hypothetical protein